MPQTAFRTLALLALTASAALAQAPAPEAPKAQGQTDSKTKAQAKPAPADDARLRPEVAAQGRFRAKTLRVRKKVAPAGPKVNLNAATKEELMKLPGITETLAAKLIAGRPYKTKAHLVTHDILPYAVYLQIKDRVEAGQ